MYRERKEKGSREGGEAKRQDGPRVVSELASAEAAVLSIIVIVLAEGGRLEHVPILGLDLVEVLVVFSAVVNLLERGEKRVSEGRAPRAEGEGTHIEVGLLELVLVDGLDLGELWMGEGEKKTDTAALMGDRQEEDEEAVEELLRGGGGSQREAERSRKGRAGANRAVVDEALVKAEEERRHRGPVVRERGVSEGEREGEREATNVEVGLLELVIVDGLDLDELLRRDESQRRRERRGEREGTNLNVLAVSSAGKGRSDDDSGKGGDDGEGSGAGEHFENLRTTRT
ncbi:hypothetical protein BCR35DRAFT_304879 [Leucosporidium creatinivorum]|uniref:Uncharacterized protein n=1 Tax=Leucosporidium creatinivorum TaxID=106004 RepID=A0A1Y2F4M4_9BASI|nr:hypothetical protein BCR35DRAFT_304879 [Leucosporidium creatinivorum]